MKTYILINDDYPVAVVQAGSAAEAATKLGGESKMLEGRFCAVINFSYERILKDPNWIKEGEQGNTHATIFHRRQTPFKISFWKNRKGKIKRNSYFLQEIPLL